MKRIAITTGDPAGIGPEITAKALRFYPLNAEVCWVVYGKLPTLAGGNKIRKISNVEEAAEASHIYWIEIDDEDVKSAKPSQKSGKIAWQILERCVQDIKANQIDAVVTAPISKEQIRKNEPEFIGHTEFFARKFHSEVIMSFWCPDFNVSLLSTHISLREVTKIFQANNIERKLRLIYNETEKYASGSRYAMLAVNPHAGEAGAFGEEEAILQLVLKKLQKQGIRIDGPFPADAFFARKAQNYDMIISAYHDQGLIPFKQIADNRGVNVTLGLPFVRTSVDHGTAFDIAGKGRASAESMEQSMYWAESKLVDVQEINNYSVFAQYYDEFMEHVPYEKWIKLILRIFIKQKQSNPKSCLELACGTANVAIRLVRRGVRIDACDISPQMLKVAAAKSPKPYLFQHDMLQKLPAKKYDLVLLLFDSINYLHNGKQMKQLLENVYETLLPGGIFVFDISTLKNTIENFENYFDLKDSENEFIVHISEFLPENREQKTTLNFFVKKHGFYKRYKEVHRQKIFTVNEIREFIGKTKFDLIGIYEAERQKNYLNANLKKLDKKFFRLFFVLEKGIDE
ncbi:MAG TPA: 4-hydroxythreonine-4-phosphate dehydrogenase PdxA [Candidatus Cloacimonas sp.]|nr:4-hydroxythreonine-4-phosphate dehydrogenase PdxA [Candidatus Cloacimonas sp.]